MCPREQAVTLSQGGQVPWTRPHIQGLLLGAGSWQAHERSEDRRFLGAEEPHPRPTIGFTLYKI